MAFVDESSTARSSGSRIISRILPPAIRLWLVSQVEHVEDLVFQIEGGDRDILSGYIPEVTLSARRAVYEGIHLSQVAVKASEISINLGQVIRRKPLRLLKAFPVSGSVILTTEDFNRSLQSPLLSEGIYDFLRLLVRSQSDAAQLQAIVDELPERSVASHYQPTASIEANQIALKLTPKKDKHVPPILITTQLDIKNGHQLCLINPHWSINEDASSKTPLQNLEGFAIDLGSEVALTECSIVADQLVLAGTIQVLPTDETE